MKSFLTLLLLAVPCSGLAGEMFFKQPTVAQKPAASTFQLSPTCNSRYSDVTDRKCCELGYDVAKNSTDWNCCVIKGGVPAIVQAACVKDAAKYEKSPSTIPYRIPTYLLTYLPPVCEVVAYDGSNFRYEAKEDKPYISDADCLSFGNSDATKTAACNFTGESGAPNGDGVTYIFRREWLLPGSEELKNYCTFLKCDHASDEATCEEDCNKKTAQIGSQIGGQACPNGCRFCR